MECLHFFAVLPCGHWELALNTFKHFPPEQSGPNPICTNDGPNPCLLACFLAKGISFYFHSIKTKANYLAFACNSEGSCVSVVGSVV
jgi:hypothetical protein